MEIERKFLVDKIPTLDSYKSDEITQAYISIEPEIRVRKKGDKYYRTEKSEGTLCRDEREWEITEDEFLSSHERAQGRVIEKTRYYIPNGEYTIELDIYKGKHAGLVVAEVEFPSEDEALSFNLPSWLGKEITYDVAFRNKILACT